MRISTKAVLCAAALAAAVHGQKPDSLLFSPRRPVSTISGSGGSVALGQFGPRAVAVVTPGGGAGSYSAELYQSVVGRQTLIGDEDGDVHTPGLMRAVDATLVKPYDRYDASTGKFMARTSPVRPNDVYISPKERVGTAVSGAPGLRRGDAGRFVRTAAGNGQVEHFIRAEHIRDAFGIVDRSTGLPLDPRKLDLDAITVDLQGNIFLSLERDRAAHSEEFGAVTPYVLQDGAIGWIPFAMSCKRRPSAVRASN